MTLLWVSVFWVFASVVTALLPMRYQYVPGVALLLAAPVLILDPMTQATRLGSMAGLSAAWIVSPSTLTRRSTSSLILTDTIWTVADRLLQGCPV